MIHIMSPFFLSRLNNSLSNSPYDTVSTTIPPAQSSRTTPAITPHNPRAWSRRARARKRRKARMQSMAQGNTRASLIGRPRWCPSPSASNGRAPAPQLSCCPRRAQRAGAARWWLGGRLHPSAAAGAVVARKERSCALMIFAERVSHRRQSRERPSWLLTHHAQQS